MRSFRRITNRKEACSAVGKKGASPAPAGGMLSTIGSELRKTAILSGAIHRMTPSANKNKKPFCNLQRGFL